MTAAATAYPSIRGFSRPPGRKWIQLVCRPSAGKLLHSPDIRVPTVRSHFNRLEAKGVKHAGFCRRNRG
jgi:hypothetical protein